jgi:hypothetical protein
MARDAPAMPTGTGTAASSTASSIRTGQDDESTVDRVRRKVDRFPDNEPPFAGDLSREWACVNVGSGLG